MKEKIGEAISGLKPSLARMAASAAGFAVALWAGLPPLSQALLIAQGADVATGLLMALTGRSAKSASGYVSSNALAMGIAKKGLEWLAVLVCMRVGAALGMEGIGGAAMSYMAATELVSLTENLKAFGLEVPALGRVLDAAREDEKAP